ncbi:MAG: 1-(5-phosphoribosyl)-5-[(5-phosphoribosylamino)methylideneamino]imidazole-4-carboxamide isomerase [Kiritimatiellae bacterium]|nr:1-(5-phosphoribosyl)-5-[(5-phosphoribosylamino)methylideneamino]imidazole-4-carboxamide isomerase [Kiritimatiellia bacterium]MDD5520326.1 1-(5-phosphoribosyl)-5-[(5-phosphoribosylamino)methylideneamino]imidazole-4-carboxamide isomerase [Kiritimatiellia bacterium]
MFTIIPAIDLKDGRCVRLKQGKADDSKIYSEDPVAMARHWVEQGAEYLHVIDLDGAFQGRPVHTSVIAQIVNAISIPVEVGGGLRTDSDLSALLKCGVARGIVGTRAVKEPEKLKKLARKFGEKVAVGIDAKKGFVQAGGWVETTKINAVELAAVMDSAGIRTIIYTDTEKDGMMAGTNVNAVGEICKVVKCSVIASGGITSAADVEALLKLNYKNLAGAIVGKALYEGTLDLPGLNNLVKRGKMPC